MSAGDGSVSDGLDGRMNSSQTIRTAGVALPTATCGEPRVKLGLQIFRNGDLGNFTIED